MHCTAAESLPKCAMRPLIAALWRGVLLLQRVWPASLLQILLDACVQWASTAGCPDLRARAAAARAYVRGICAATAAERAGLSLHVAALMDSTPEVADWAVTGADGVRLEDRDGGGCARFCTATASEACVRALAAAEAEADALADACQQLYQLHGVRKGGASLAGGALASRAAWAHLLLGARAAAHAEYRTCAPLAAAAAARNVADKFTRALGPDHPVSLGARGQLAGALAAARRHDEAVCVLEGVVQARVAEAEATTCGHGAAASRADPLRALTFAASNGAARVLVAALLQTTATSVDGSCDGTDGGATSAGECARLLAACLRSRVATEASLRRFAAATRRARAAHSLLAVAGGSKHPNAVDALMEAGEVAAAGGSWEEGARAARTALASLPTKGGAIAAAGTADARGGGVAAVAREEDEEPLVVLARARAHALLGRALLAGAEGGGGDGSGGGGAVLLPGGSGSGVPGLLADAQVELRAASHALSRLHSRHGLSCPSAPARWVTLASLRCAELAGQWGDALAGYSALRAEAEEAGEKPLAGAGNGSDAVSALAAAAGGCGGSLSAAEDPTSLLALEGADAVGALAVAEDPSSLLAITSEGADAAGALAAAAVACGAPGAVMAVEGTAQRGWEWGSSLADDLVACATLGEGRCLWLSGRRREGHAVLAGAATAVAAARGDSSWAVARVADDIGRFLASVSMTANAGTLLQASLALKREMLSHATQLADQPPQRTATAASAPHAPPPPPRCARCPRASTHGEPDLADPTRVRAPFVGAAYHYWTCWPTAPYHRLDPSPGGSGQSTEVALGRSEVAGTLASLGRLVAASGRLGEASDTLSAAAAAYDACGDVLRAARLRGEAAGVALLAAAVDQDDFSSSSSSRGGSAHGKAKAVGAALLAAAAEQDGGNTAASVSGILAEGCGHVVGGMGRALALALGARTQLARLLGAGSSDVALLEAGVVADAVMRSTGGEQDKALASIGAVSVSVLVSRAASVLAATFGPGDVRSAGAAAKAAALGVAGVAAGLCRPRACAVAAAAAACATGQQQQQGQQRHQRQSSPDAPSPPSAAHPQQQQQPAPAPAPAQPQLSTHPARACCGPELASAVRLAAGAVGAARALLSALGDDGSGDGVGGSGRGGEGNKEEGEGAEEEEEESAVVERAHDARLAAALSAALCSPAVMLPCGAARAAARGRLAGALLTFAQLGELSGVAGAADVARYGSAGAAGAAEEAQRGGCTAVLQGAYAEAARLYRSLLPVGEALAATTATPTVATATAAACAATAATVTHSDSGDGDGSSGSRDLGAHQVLRVHAWTRAAAAVALAEALAGHARVATGTARTLPQPGACAGSIDRRALDAARRAALPPDPAATAALPGVSADAGGARDTSSSSNDSNTAPPTGGSPCCGGAATPGCVPTLPCACRGFGVGYARLAGVSGDVGGSLVPLSTRRAAAQRAVTELLQAADLVKGAGAGAGSDVALGLQIDLAFILLVRGDAPAIAEAEARAWRVLSSLHTHADAGPSPPSLLGSSGSGVPLRATLPLGPPRTRAATTAPAVADAHLLLCEVQLAAARAALCPPPPPPSQAPPPQSPLALVQLSRSSSGVWAVGSSSSPAGSPARPTLLPPQSPSPAHMHALAPCGSSVHTVPPRPSPAAAARGTHLPPRSPLRAIVTPTHGLVLMRTRGSPARAVVTPPGGRAGRMEAKRRAERGAQQAGRALEALLDNGAAGGRLVLLGVRVFDAAAQLCSALGYCCSTSTSSGDPSHSDGASTHAATAVHASMSLTASLVATLSAHGGLGPGHALATAMVSSAAGLALGDGHSGGVSSVVDGGGGSARCRGSALAGAHAWAAAHVRTLEGAVLAAAGGGALGGCASGSVSSSDSCGASSSSSASRSGGAAARAHAARSALLLLLPVVEQLRQAVAEDQAEGRASASAAAAAAARLQRHAHDAPPAAAAGPAPAAAEATTTSTTSTASGAEQAQQQQAGQQHQQQRWTRPTAAGALLSRLLTRSRGLAHKALSLSGGGSGGSSSSDAANRLGAATTSTSSLVGGAQAGGKGGATGAEAVPQPLTKPGAAHASRRPEAEAAEAELDAHGASVCIVRAVGVAGSTTLADAQGLAATSLDFLTR
ncbi:hypothetical protein FOA52_002326 [Chlamydomonas sp. UWO 241]|nr:hypothetical protein FOA52_002326 [Chlamydomonas sp. UWO 241]